MAEAEKTIRQSKAQIKECLLKLRDVIKSEEERLSIARYLIKNYGGVSGVKRGTVSSAF